MIIDPHPFKLGLGDEVEDLITGFKGIVVSCTQWLNNCNTYGVQATTLKDGVPQDRSHFDEPQLRLVRAHEHEAARDTGGPARPVPQANR